MKKVKFVFAIAIAVAVMMTLSACSLFGDGDTTTDDDAPKQYTIQYTDDEGPHTITVTEGEPYALEKIPSRKGYVFTGLYDDEVGGTRFVNAQGASLSVYNEGKSMVLFPRFEPIQLTLVLDFGDAAYYGQKRIEVAYGDPLPQLPSQYEIDLADYEFVGWYDSDRYNAKQLTDNNGIAIADITIDFDAFTANGSNITLYARFEPVDHMVTLIYSQSEQAIQLEYKHGEQFSPADVKMFNNGLAVTAWSTQKNDMSLMYEFDGVVTEDVTLYPARWSRSATYTRNTQELVGSDGFGKEFSEYPDLKSLFGKSVAELKASSTDVTNKCGYVKAEIALSLTLHEIDDGYQLFRVSNSSGKNLCEKEFEHGSGKKDTSTETYTFKFTADIDDLTDILTIDYDARGSFDDDWVLEKTVMKVTLYQQ